ncbi:MAG: hypothetical protein HOM25_20185 [Rhodospirillaceae bacterium]|nr:hypothetical protein [Rhodospirillaceae bacterium]
MKRKPINLTPLTNGDFDDAYFDHLKNFEGVVKRIHTDGLGVPTIGMGTALAVRITNKKFQLRKDLDARIDRATRNNYKLTEPERQRLQDAVDALNAGNPAKAKKLIPPYDANEGNTPNLRQANNKFGFTIDDEGMRAVARPDMASARDAAWNGVAAAAKDSGWSAAEIGAYKKQFYASREMIALASIKYNLGNNAKLPKTNRHIVNGDRAGAVYEIEIRTNGNKTPGHANRRVTEAKFFADGMNGADRTALARHVAANPQEYEEYAKRFTSVVEKSATAGSLKPASPSDAPETGAPETPAPPSGVPEGETVGASLGDNPANPGDSDNSDAPESLSFTPEQQALKAALLQDDGPAADLMVKDPAHWTEGEFQLAKRETARLRPGSERTNLDAMATAFLVDKYGDGPARLDATGRMIDPQPINPINEVPIDATAPGGGSLRDEMTRIADVVANTARVEGASPAVAALQNGLNILDEHTTAAERQNGGGQKAKTVKPFPKLKSTLLRIDGVPGSRTRQAFRAAAALLGAPKVEEGLALGRFAKFARNATAGRPAGDVKSVVQGTFAPLFRSPEKPRPVAGAEEDLAFQATVNDLGEEVLGGPKFTPIREDGDLGPKTEGAFRTVLPAAGATRFTTRLGQNLGFLDLDKPDGFA